MIVDYKRTLQLLLNISMAKVTNYDWQSLVTNNILVESRGLKALGPYITPGWKRAFTYLTEIKAMTTPQ